LSFGRVENEVSVLDFNENIAQLKRWWLLICALEPDSLADQRFPLAGLQKYSESLDLPDLPVIDFKPPLPKIAETDKPSFLHLSEEVLLHLRLCLSSGEDIALVSDWAEKLLRFCEIRFSSLKERAIDKWGDLDSARLNLLHLTAFFLDYFNIVRDLRYLNIVLKMMDLRWIVRWSKISADLQRKDERFISALFQVRVLLMVEAELVALEHDR
jgi:hypothetical protein